MSALCSQCGDPNCAAYRAAARREPWLPGGFELGAQWHSHDGGLTWLRGECERCFQWPQFVDIVYMLMRDAVNAIAVVFPSVRDAYCSPGDYIAHNLKGDRCEFVLAPRDRFTVHVSSHAPPGRLWFGRADARTMTVTKIDRDRGEVTVKVGD